MCGVAVVTCACLFSSKNGWCFLGIIKSLTALIATKL